MNTKAVAIVTGASQGIGQATALRLARDFSAVVLVARDKDHLDKTASEVKLAGAEAMVCAIDLRDPRAAETLVSETLERFGTIDALLNIAGAVPQIDLFEMTDSQWDDGMALKFHGARRLTVRAWDVLKASKGSVVLISTKRCSRSEAGIRTRGGNQRSDHCTRESVRRAGDQERSSGQQRSAGSCDDWAAPLVLRELGACALTSPSTKPWRDSPKKPESAASENRKRLPICRAISFPLSLSG